MSDVAFINYYEVLQVSPNCTPKILESAYRHLAKMYHPDHPETADMDRFNGVVEAYRTLRDPASRIQYDHRHRTRVNGADGNSTESARPPGLGDAVSDADIHEKILSLLYKKRRENAQDAGMGGYHIQESIACSDEHFDFHVWYLKSKGFIEITEQGTWAITIDGVDHVISISRAAHEEKRLIPQINL